MRMNKIASTFMHYLSTQPFIEMIHASIEQGMHIPRLEKKPWLQIDRSAGAEFHLFLQ